jgi:hypothetical protein
MTIDDSLMIRFGFARNLSFVRKPTGQYGKSRRQSGRRGR